MVPPATRVMLESQRNWLVIIAELKTSPGLMAKKKKEAKEENKRKQPAGGINSGGVFGGGGGGALTMGWEISPAQTWWNFCSC